MRLSNSNGRERLWWAAVALVGGALCLLVLVQSVHAAPKYPQRVTETCMVDTVEKFPNKALYYTTAICVDTGHVAGFNTRRKFTVGDRLSVTGDYYGGYDLSRVSVRKVR